MRSMTLTTLVFGLLLFSFRPGLRAADQEDLRAKVAAMQKEAAVLAQQGKKDEAERLLQKIRELVQRAQASGQEQPPLQVERPVARLMRVLEDLRAKERQLRESKASEKDLAEVREMIARTEREIQSRRAGGPGAGEQHPEARGLEEVARRIHHLRAAAENLKAAGAHGLAGQLMEIAEVMERDLRAARERMTADQGRPAHLEEQVQALRKEVERLRAEVEELKKLIRKP